MSIKPKAIALATVLAITAGVVAVGAPHASAATLACGPYCVSVFSKELGSYAQPGPVEDVQDGTAAIGQPLILKPASGSDPSEDTIPNLMPVSAFFAAGMVSADVNTHFGTMSATQLQYAPNGVPTGLCVGLATVAYQNEGLTLQACTRPAVTVWILDATGSTAAGYFAIVNGSTTDFDHPFAMDLPQDEVVSAHQLLQIHVRRLQFLGSDMSLPDRDLWGVHRGAFS